jgi:hypothetical protein
LRTLSEDKSHVCIATALRRVNAFSPACKISFEIEAVRGWRPQRSLNLERRLLECFSISVIVRAKRASQRDDIITDVLRCAQDVFALKYRL